MAYSNCSVWIIIRFWNNLSIVFSFVFYVIIPKWPVCAHLCYRHRSSHTDNHAVTVKSKVWVRMLQREFSVSAMVGWYRTREFYLPSRRVDLSGSRGRDTARRPTSPCFGAFSPPPPHPLCVELPPRPRARPTGSGRKPHSAPYIHGIASRFSTSRNWPRNFSSSLCIRCSSTSWMYALVWSTHAGILAESVSLRFSSIVTVIRYPWVLSVSVMQENHSYCWHLIRDF